MKNIPHLELYIFSVAPLGEKSYVLPKSLSCDQKFHKFLEIWTVGPPLSAILNQRSFDQDLEPIMCFVPPQYPPGECSFSCRVVVLVI